jgi:hypothetical protein
MEDASTEWLAPMSNQIVRPPSPNRVLAVQTHVNEILKVKDEEPAQLSNEPKSKKRRRDSDEDISDAVPEGLAAVFLKREKLLTISSADHESLVQRISNVRDLTDLELKEVKRQRRLIKNREYAQTSRQKKKVTMGHVKEQVNSLESENDDLKAELAMMRNRVMELELENASLRAQISKDSTSSEDSYDAVVDVDVAPASSKRSTFGFRPTMAASAVLFVFLFAFGFLFNSPLFNAAFSTSSLPGARSVTPYSTGRTIFSAEPFSNVNYEPSMPESARVLPSSTTDLNNVSNEFLNACFNAGNNTC